MVFACMHRTFRLPCFAAWLWCLVACDSFSGDTLLGGGVKANPLLPRSLDGDLRKPPSKFEEAGPTAHILTGVWCEPQGGRGGGVLVALLLRMRAGLPLWAPLAGRWGLIGLAAAPAKLEPFVHRAFVGCAALRSRWQGALALLPSLRGTESAVPALGGICEVRGALALPHLLGHRDDGLRCARPHGRATPFNTGVGLRAVPRDGPCDDNGRAMAGALLLARPPVAAEVARWRGGGRLCAAPTPLPGVFCSAGLLRGLDVLALLAVLPMDDGG
mmetsp:Transcript_115837/g.258931  ORF Transcript_115837/g.258931 Transcript_115837/m.258931 type:complete len:273 (+) Transcript_115837:259-1077(+)